jgi:hypothetical protein
LGVSTELSIGIESLKLIWAQLKCNGRDWFSIRIVTPLVSTKSPNQFSSPRRSLPPLGDLEYRILNELNYRAGYFLAVAPGQFPERGEVPLVVGDAVPLPLPGDVPAQRGFVPVLLHLNDVAPARHTR